MYRFLPRIALSYYAFLFIVRAEPIDRHAWVTRHNPTIHAIDPQAPFSVGNGGFAFTCDVTGLQTFSDYYYKNGIPTETLARWAWHTDPNPSHFTLDDANVLYAERGRMQAYPTKASNPAGIWLRENPRDIPLAQIGLDLKKADGSAVGPTDITHLSQTEDMWSGTITSDYQIEGVPVRVVTVCHPDHDLLAVRIESPLITSNHLGVKLAFPRGHNRAQKNTPALDWSLPESHRSTVALHEPRRVEIERAIDDTHYSVRVESGSNLKFSEESPHHFLLATEQNNPVLEFTIAFSAAPLPKTLPSAEETRATSAAHWKKFWSTGGVVDFSGSRDPRANELERRVVLSQYLTAIQFGGDMPPQESGLTCSTWYGKHNSEMVWWHTAHFAQWGHDEYLANTLRWFQSHLPEARSLAQSRQLKGARWAKMVGPEDRESPGGNPLIIWNQPHVVYLCELLYRNQPTAEILTRYRDLVQETAECLASMTSWDDTRHRYVLGPPLWISQEIYDQTTSQNPTFELSYWAFALETAQTWRERLGLGRSSEWDKIIKNLSPLPVRDGLYVALESQPDTFLSKKSRSDHPTMLAPLGVLPGTLVDRETMRRTLNQVLKTWDWETKIWGWDYPMIAMTAARLGEPQTAIDILLSERSNNYYTANGHCPQRGDLALYMPANSALLAAVALMAGGWDGSAQPAPGFPRNDQWSVRVESIHPFP